MLFMGSVLHNAPENIVITNTQAIT